jgi:opacity protein-like surface antigen
VFQPALKRVFSRAAFRFICVAPLAAGAMPASAYEFTDVREATQGQFSDIAQDMLSAVSFRSMTGTSASPIGRWEFGAYATTTFVDDETWRAAVDSNVDTLEVVGATASFQLRHNLRLGVLAAAINDTDDQLYGIDLQYPLLSRMGGTAVLALRGSASFVYGVEDFHITSQTLELRGSHRLRAWLTPFAGLGIAMAQFNPAGSVDLEAENPIRPTAEIGAMIHLSGFELSGAIQQTGSATGLGLRLSAVF